MSSPPPRLVVRAVTRAVEALLVHRRELDEVGEVLGGVLPQLVGVLGVGSNLPGVR